MDGWGEKMLGTVCTVSEIVAVGLGLDRDAFTSRMQMGPHLLAPTGGQYSTASSMYLSILHLCIRRGLMHVKHSCAHSWMQESKLILTAAVPPRCRS